MRLLSLLLLPLFLVLARAQAADGPETQSHYFSFHQGDQWVLEVTLIAPDGKEMKATIHRRIGEEVQRNGKTYFRFYDHRDEPTKMEHTFLRRRDAIGVFSLDDGDEEAEEQPDALFPLQPGQSWEAKDKDGGVKVSVVGVESVTIEGKSYENCFHIRFVHENGNIGDQWEAPDFGPVKYIGRKLDGTKGVFALREFRPAQ
jgi:hypothetical protein